MEGFISRDALNLSDHQAAGIACCGGHAQTIQRERLSLHRDVPIRVSRSPPNQSDIDWKAFIKKPSLAVNFVKFHEVFRSNVIELAPAQTRVHESAQSDFGKIAGPMRRDISEEMAD
jgi:hypothetical protein